MEHVKKLNSHIISKNNPRRNFKPLNKVNQKSFIKNLSQNPDITFPLFLKVYKKN